MYHTPLTCYEQENLRHMAHFEAFSKALKLVNIEEVFSKIC
jgi:hypothetical protein